MSGDLLLMWAAGGGGLPPNLRRGLVAWYDPWKQVQLGDDGQNFTDYSGHGNHATLGATSASSTDDPVWTGNSLLFDGVDDKITHTPATQELWAIGADGTNASWTSSLPAANAGSAYYVHMGLLYDRTLTTTEEAQAKAYLKRLLAPREVTIS